MHRAAHVGSAGLLTLLAACGGGRQQAAQPAGFPPAPLPMYSAGDSYTFDDGTVDTVTGVANGEVRWHTATGARFVTLRDVLLPPIAWADANQEGRRSYAAAGTLFPLQPGGGVTATATVSRQPSGGGPDAGTQEAWQCQVGDAQRTRVAAGSFDTVQVDCAVKQAPGGQYEQRTYYYAPSIGYYVRRIDRIGDAPPRSVELTAWTDGNPPLLDSALQQRVAAMQQALESQPSGAAVRWQDAATQSAGSVEPVRTARAADGRWCRDFQEHVTAFGRRYALTGEACRETAGGWQVENVYPSPAAEERTAQSAG